MRGRARVALAGCAGGVLLLACARPADTPQVAAAHEEAGECVLLRTIGAFRALDDRRILIDSQPRKVIEVYSDCTGLRFSEDVALEGRDERVCDYRGDKLIVDGRRCTIASIREYRPERELGPFPRSEINEETLDDRDARQPASSAPPAP